MGVSIISPGVHQSFGGPTKTIGAFQKALGAELYSCCQVSRLREDPLAIDSAKPVGISSIPVLRQFGWVPPRLRHALEEEISSSRLISCHLFYRYHNFWVRNMMCRHGVPYWFVPHGVLDPWVMSYGQMVKKAFWSLGGRQFLEDATALIFSTNAEREKAESQFNLPQSEVIPWPVELVDLREREHRRERIRRQLSIPEEAKVLLYFGRLHPMKRPLETIEAISRVKDPNLHLIIVGNEFGISGSDCLEIAQSRGCLERTHFVGAVFGSSKYDYLHAADAYISLSQRENFNHTAAESLAAGLPVLLSPGNDLSHEFKEVGCSWQLSDNEISTAVNALEEFVALPHEKLRAMGDLGREWVAVNLAFSLFEERLKGLAEKYQRA